MPPRVEVRQRFRNDCGHACIIWDFSDFNKQWARLSGIKIVTLNAIALMEVICEHFSAKSRVSRSWLV